MSQIDRLRKRKIKDFILNNELETDNEFVTNFKNAYSLSKMKWNSYIASKERDDDLVNCLNFISRSVDLNNNSFRESRRLFIWHKMHKILTDILKQYLKPRFEISQISLLSQATHKVRIWFDNLCALDFASYHCNIWKLAKNWQIVHIWHWNCKLR